MNSKLYQCIDNKGNEEALTIGYFYISDHEDEKMIFIQDNFDFWNWYCKEAFILV